MHASPRGLLGESSQQMSLHLYTEHKREEVLGNRGGFLRGRRYELLHVVRTHMGSSDASYGCVFHKEDSEGKTGVYLSKELMAIAGHALKANITTLGPLVLPLSEQILFFLNLIARKVCSPFPRPTQ